MKSTSLTQFLFGGCAAGVITILLGSVALAQNQPATEGTKAGTSQACETTATGATCAPSQTECASVCSPASTASSCVSSCAPAGNISGADPAGNIDLATLGAVPADLGIVDLGSILEPIRKKFNIPSLSVAVVKGDQLISAGATGVRSAYAPEAVSITDRYHLGSCGKAFTATVAARLVERGAIGWGTTVAEVFPEYSESMRPEYRSVSLAQLLSHRSGLPSGPDRDPANEIWNQVEKASSTASQTRAVLVSHALQSVPVSAPGESFLYTDYGFIVAGAMLEKVTGQAFQDLMQEHVAAPLGLKSLGEGAPGVRDAVDEPRGHVVENGKLVALEPGPGADLAHPAIQPAGTLHASTLDWARFAADHMGAFNHEGSLLFSTKAGKDFYTDRFKQGYTNGWQIGTLGTGDSAPTVLHHTGTCGAWAARVWIVPQTHIAIVATSNYGGAEGFAAINEAIDAAYASAFKSD